MEMAMERERVSERLLSKEINGYGMYAKILIKRR